MSHLLSNFLIWQNIGQGEEGKKRKKISQDQGGTDLYEALELILSLAGSPSRRAPGNPVTVTLDMALTVVKDGSKRSSL